MIHINLLGLFLFVDGTIYTEAKIVKKKKKTSLYSAFLGSEISVQPNQPASKKYSRLTYKTRQILFTSGMDSWIGPHILVCKKWPQIPQLSKLHISFANMDEL